MAEVQEKDPAVRTKTVLNRTVVGRVYHTKDGRRLEPGATLDVSEEDYKRLTQYHDIVDPDKLGARAKSQQAVLKENEELRKKLAKLEAEGADAEKLKEQIAELQEKLAKAVKK